MRAFIPCRCISDIHMAQAGLYADMPGKLQTFRRSAGSPGHQAARKEGRDMPGGIRAKAVVDKVGDPGTFLGVVIDAGHEQCGNLQPPAQTAHAYEIVQHPSQTRPTELSVTCIGKTFQIDVGRVNERSKGFKAGRTLVSVADHDSSEARTPCLFGACAHKFKKNCRLGVRESDTGAVMSARGPNERIRRNERAFAAQGASLLPHHRKRGCGRFERMLYEEGRTRNFTVLTPCAIEIAAEGAQGKC